MNPRVRAPHLNGRMPKRATRAVGADAPLELTRDATPTWLVVASGVFGFLVTCLFVVGVFLCA